MGTRRLRRALLLTAGVGLLAASALAPAVAHSAARFTLKSPSFRPGATIPRRHTCDGANRSPRLVWSSPPRAALSFALLVDDPDAPGGTFTHWFGWGIGKGVRALASGEALPVEGLNDVRVRGYQGPCPPPGDGPHRYVFRLYALDARLTLPRGASRDSFLRALKGHIIQVARLVGTYER